MLVNMDKLNEGDRFKVKDGEVVELYNNGNLNEYPVAHVEVEWIHDNEVNVSHHGPHPDLPLHETVTFSDINDAIGDWLEQPD